MSNHPSRRPSRRTSPRNLILALLACGLFNGTFAGIVDWVGSARGVPPGATFAGYLAWRAASTLIATAVGAAVVYPFVRPLKKDRVGAMLMIPAAMAFRSFSRDEFLFELIFFTIFMGLVIGVSFRVLTWALRARAVGTEDRSRR